MVSSAISLYMSVLENLTSLDANPEQCSLCGQLKYGITGRVGDIADKYLNKDMARLMKKSYSMRSKYLHTANSFIDNRMYTIPQVDDSTEIGCRVNGFLSIMIDGSSYLFTCMNVHEWVSYILRQTISDRILYNETSNRYDNWDV